MSTPCAPSLDALRGGLREAAGSAGPHPSAGGATGAATDRLASAFDAELDGLWRFLRRLGIPAGSVEDAVQEVFAVAARRLSEIRPGAEKSFLFGTALRVAQAARRRRAVDASRYQPLVEDAPSADQDPEQLLTARRSLALLDAILASLGEPSREVFVLFELEGFTLTEVAALLQIPRGTVASRLRRARTDFLQAARRARAELQIPGGDHG